ncbi:MAG: hypothetical protein JXR83_23180 [Deltaproteobacteria bacterium]|nr:hypothetical protein [Deltaproteobacteria bacterium]
MYEGSRQECVLTAAVLACLLLASASSPQGVDSTVRTFQSYIADLQYASKISIRGLGGNAVIDECVFDPEPPATGCPTRLGVDVRTWRYLHRNSKYLKVSGRLGAGFRLIPNDARLTELKRARGAEPYVKIIQTRANYVKADQMALDRAAYDAALKRRNKQALAAWKSPPPKIAVAVVAKAKADYLRNLKDQHNFERDLYIRAWLEEEIRKLESPG